MAFIYYLTQIQIDFGAINLLAAECERVGIRRPLIVTDPGVKAVGILQLALDALPGLSVAVYDQTPSNPTEAAVRAAVAVYHAQGCDGLIAVGGGSAIDCAKGVAIAATHEGPLKTYATIEGGSARITDRAAPLIAVPTTAGTGSEVTVAAVIADPERQSKLVIVDPRMVPRMAALDPSLCTGLPPHITAATGIDALTHAVESFVGNWATPYTDGMALTAVGLIFENLRTACRHGGDLQAREKMLLASTYAGIAFTRANVGYVHAIAHQFGGRYHTPHGLANAIVLPHVLRFSASAVTQRRTRRIVSSDTTRSAPGPSLSLRPRSAPPPSGLGRPRTPPRR